MSEPTVVPMLAYRDGVAALEWLARAFGFVETRRWLDGERLSHGEMETPLGGHVMLATPTPHYRGPRAHAAECELARKWTEDVPWVIDGVLVYVADVAAHRARAEAAGAVMLGGIETGGPGPRYRCEDCEGHRWMFMQRA